MSGVIGDFKKIGLESSNIPTKFLYERFWGLLEV